MQSAWKATAYVLWVGASVAGGYLLITLSPGKAGAAFLARPQAHLWVLAIAAQAGLWAAVTPLLWRTCLNYRPETQWAWAGWLLLSVVAIALLVTLFRVATHGPGPSFPLAHQSGRILVLTIVGLTLLSPGLLAMCLIRRRLRMTTSPDPADWTAVAKQARELLGIREDLAQVLLALGLAVGVVTLATGALRAAFLAYQPRDANHFPASGPWLYGAGATVVLAAAYFPAYFALQRASRRLVDATYPLDWKDRPAEDWYSQRASFVELLKVEIGPMRSFRTGVAILAPLVGSLLGILLPGK